MFKLKGSAQWQEIHRNWKQDFDDEDETMNLCDYSTPFMEKPLID